MVKAPVMLTCPQWGARPARHAPQVAGRPSLIVEHHTDGHAGIERSLARTPYNEAVSYARALQHLHMEVNGWSDSGHSFLVMRSGIILQGRWGTVRAIESGRMVVSAHCPGMNDQPGIEHEHLPGEPFTAAQLAATVRLQAWICAQCGIRPTELYPHRRFYATACPGNLGDDIPRLRLLVAQALTAGGPRQPARRRPSWVLGRRIETA